MAVTVSQTTTNVTVSSVGIAGKDGTSGTSGINGTNGTSGVSGTSGLDGTFFGSSGTSGINGSSGSSGTSGVSGTSGISGTFGSSGTSGTSGISGSSGTSGTSGLNGTYFGSSGTSGLSIDSSSLATTGSNIFDGIQTISGSIYVSGSIIPNGSGSFDLGSLDNPFRDLYISSQSLKIVNDGIVTSISVDVNGALNISGSDTSFLLKGSGSREISFDGRRILFSDSGSNPKGEIQADDNELRVWAGSLLGGVESSLYLYGSDVYLRGDSHIRILTDKIITPYNNLVVDSKLIVSSSYVDTSLKVNGNSEFTGSVYVSSSISASNLHLTDIATLSNVHPLPNGNTGSLVVSESFGYSNLYLHNGNDWVVLQTGSIY